MYPRARCRYYIDVGASDLIIDGRIAVKSGVENRPPEENAIVMADAATLPADSSSTRRYGPMNDWAATADLSGSRRTGWTVLGLVRAQQDPGLGR